MSQIMYFTDLVGGVLHATFVHSGGHVLLRNVPPGEADALKETVREWRNTLPDAESVTIAEIEAFLQGQGFERIHDYNPPLVAYSFKSPPAVDPDSLSAMTVSGLRALAASLGLSDTGEMRKAQIVEAVQAKIAEGA